MSGGKLAYHLRPNKAVERQLFLDLLLRIQGYEPIHNNRYIGFGGPFLEDFKLIHSQLGLTKLTSIENDPDVLKRQDFNRPLDCILRLETDSARFIKDFRRTEGTIIWLDYVKPSALRSQLQEFRSLVAKLANLDILKITVNANPEAVAPFDASEVARRLPREEKWRRHFESLQHRLADYLPEDATEEQMTLDLLPGVLLRAVNYAAAKGLEGRVDNFVPLTSYYYGDSAHNMLTVSGILLRDEQISEFMRRTGIDSWPLGLPIAKEPIRVAVPSLSTRERLFLEQLLPGTAPQLPFLCEDNEDESEAALSSYARFYRHYPYYSRFIP